MSKGKVLYVATVVKKHINAFHLPFLEYFKGRGFETSVCARDDFGDEQCFIPNCDNYYNIQFEKNPFKIGNIKAYYSLKKVIEKGDFDIIHCHTPVGGILTRLAARKARKKGTKVMYTAHGFHFFKGASIVNWLVFYQVERWCSRFTDVLITINSEDYKLAKSKMKAKKVYYVPGVGVDAERFNKKEAVDSSILKDLGIEDGATIILSVGELNKNKNHKVVIEALAKINNPKVNYLIAGVGELEERLKELCRELKVENQVKFLGFRKDIDKLCNISDVFCFPSCREGLSLSVMEAMASSLPVVCSDIRGNNDLIHEKLGGYLCRYNSSEEFSLALSNVIESKELREKMGKYNKQYIKKFELDNVMNIMKKIYEEQ